MNKLPLTSQQQEIVPETKFPEFSGSEVLIFFLTFFLEKLFLFSSSGGNPDRSTGEEGAGDIVDSPVIFHGYFLETDQKRHNTTLPSPTVTDQLIQNKNDTNSWPVPNKRTVLNYYFMDLNEITVIFLWPKWNIDPRPSKVTIVFRMHVTYFKKSTR